jgi:hypothetical protein
VLQVSGGKGGAALARLSHAINDARQLTRAERGKGLDAERADQIAAHLRAAQNLVRGREVAAVEKIAREAPPPPVIQTGTRRFKLWRACPLCIWCGRMTRIEGVHQEDAATLDHLRRRDERKRKSSIPDTVLACRECNNHRGQPKATTSDACPVVEQTRRAA